jgi:hypothetical protein
MLRLSNDLLKICQAIKNSGIEFSLVPGSRLARGFADLGFEEFILLEGNRLISLYRGTQSEFLMEEQKHFFRIPNLLEIQQAIYELNYNIIEMEFKDQREWYLKLENQQDKKIVENSAKDLESLFIRILNDLSITR